MFYPKSVDALDLLISLKYFFLSSLTIAETHYLWLPASKVIDYISKAILPEYPQNENIHDFMQYLGYITYDQGIGQFVSIDPNTGIPVFEGISGVIDEGLIFFLSLSLPILLTFKS